MLTWHNRALTAHRPASHHTAQMAGHYLMIDQPRAFHAQVLHALGRAPAPAAAAPGDAAAAAASLAADTDAAARQDAGFAREEMAEVTGREAEPAPQTTTR